MAKDRPTSDELSAVAVQEEDDEVELSLDLSIGRGFRKSPRLPNSLYSGENFSAGLTNVVVTTTPIKADTNLFSSCSASKILGDSEQESGSEVNGKEVQTNCRAMERKRKRNETQTNGFQEKVWRDAIRERSNERGMSIVSIGCKSLANETNSYDTQFRSNESRIPRPVVWRSFSLKQGDQEPSSGGVCSGDKDDENTMEISQSGSSSILSSGFISSASQQDQLEVNVPASQAWEVYSSLKLAKITEEKLGNLIERLEIEGDGGVGTLVKLVFPPGGAFGFDSYTEKFTKIDHEKRVKETEVIEGGYLNLGFNLFRVRLEVIEKEGASPPSCITRSTIEYEIKEEFAANASVVSIQALVTVMQAAADFLLAQTNN